MPLSERDINISLQHNRGSAANPPMPAKNASKSQSKLPLPSSTTPKPSSSHTRKPRTKLGHDDFSMSATTRMQTQADNRSAMSSPTPAQRGATTPPSLDKPLPKDKPLPSKPVAQLSSTPSPSKHGRSLIDAVEQPLHMTSITGSKHEWPSLKPQSVSPSTSTPSMDSPSRFPEDEGAYSTPLSDTAGSSIMSYKGNQYPALSSDDSASVTAFPRAADLERVYSSSHSYVTANNAPISSPSHSSTLSVKKTRSLSSSVSDLHAIGKNKPGSGTVEKRNSVDEFNSRQMSLRKRISEGSLVTRGSGASQKIIGFTDYTRSGASSPSLDESRVHTPSPASFSQPRPNSIVTPSTTSRMKTASRIPLPENKAAKPTIVHVKDRSSAASTSTSQKDSQIGASYGSRRLDAPNALQILDQGVRRRQMKRNLSNEQGTQLKPATSEESMHDLAGALKPPRNRTSSSNHTYDPSSPEDSTPPLSFSDEEDSPQEHIRRHSVFQSAANHGFVPMSPGFDDDQRRIPSYYLGADNVSMRDTRPPPTSPYTAPLPTIHSQAALGAESLSSEDKVPGEISNALSQLEGRGSPPRQVSVDEGTLIRMFGRLKPSFSKTEPSSLADNAAAAERYLTMRDSDLQSKAPPSMGVPSAQDEEAWNLRDSGAGKRQTPTDIKHNLVSKWSCTTPSEHALSPASADLLSWSRRDEQAQPTSFLRSVPEDFTPTQKEESSGSQVAPQDSLPKSLPARNISNGTPSRIPIGTGIPSSKSSANLPKRQSSPTLGGERPPGSVRNARETMHSGHKGYAKSTASADSRKALKFPRSNNKVPAIPENLRKSRNGAPRESDSSMKRDASSSKLERSRSKGRYMLNKINGLLPGRRDKKSSVVPLVPRIEESRIQSISSKDRFPGPQYPPHGAVRVATTAKLHSASSGLRPTLRRLSTSSAAKEDVSLVDSVGVGAGAAASAAEDPSHSLQTLSEHLVEKARHEVDLSRKERLLSFAKVLTDSLIAVREAHISAETAKQAAKSAQMSLEMTQRGLALLQKLAISLNANGPASGRS